MERVGSNGGTIKSVQLKADVTYNCKEDDVLTLQLKVCQPVVTKVITKLGKHISGFEPFMQESFNVHITVVSILHTRSTTLIISVSCLHTDARRNFPIHSLP